MPKDNQSVPKFAIMPKRDLKLPPILQSRDKDSKSSLKNTQSEKDDVEELLANLSI